MRYLIILIFVCALLTACQAETEPTPPTPITSFDECVAAGNPVMESYPRQCRAQGETFVEDVPPITPPEEQQFVVCKETITGFDPVEYAEQVNGVCVDSCPEKYDPYVTQIGITLCIPHYGVEDIEQWDLCEASSETCDCVKAYETTDETPKTIEQPQYRCVPSQYAERLLFRAGLDRLDEQGQASVMIA